MPRCRKKNVFHPYYKGRRNVLMQCKGVGLKGLNGFCMAHASEAVRRKPQIRMNMLDQKLAELKFQHYGEMAERKRMHELTLRKALSDTYIKRIIQTLYPGMRASQIPQKLIEKKRESVMAKRLHAEYMEASK